MCGIVLLKVGGVNVALPKGAQNVEFLFRRPCFCRVGIVQRSQTDKKRHVLDQDATKPLLACRLKQMLSEHDADAQIDLFQHSKHGPSVSPTVSPKLFVSYLRRRTFLFI